MRPSGLLPARVFLGFTMCGKRGSRRPDILRLKNGPDLLFLLTLRLTTKAGVKRRRSLNESAYQLEGFVQDYGKA